MEKLLPSSIWTLIFQYDRTYHEKYRNVLQELKSKVLWKIVWINSDRKTEYYNSKNYCDTILKYWNVTYANYYSLIPSENSHQCTEGLIILKDVKF